MNELFGNAVKSVFSSLGLFLARRFPDAANGYRLEDDLPVLIDRNCPVCFDIGANCGQTIQLLQRCFDRPIIHAFEPASNTYASLASQPFGVRVKLHQLALGERTGVAEFRNYKQSELSSFLPMNSNKAENIFAEEELLSIEKVQVVTLDKFCSTDAIDRIDLLKIDTQGFELPVLLGAADLFRKKKIGAVMLELNFATLYEGQSDSLDVLQLMRSYGMRLVDFYEKERAHGKELSWTTALFIQ